MSGWKVKVFCLQEKKEDFFGRLGCTVICKVREVGWKEFPAVGGNVCGSML